MKEVHLVENLGVERSPSIVGHALLIGFTALFVLLHLGRKPSVAAVAPDIRLAEVVIHTLVEDSRPADNAFAVLRRFNFVHKRLPLFAVRVDGLLLVFVGERDPAIGPVSPADKRGEF